MEEIWTTVHGGWGDAIANYGNIVAFLKESNQDKANVVFFGLDKEIIPFLKAQKHIDKVQHLKITSISEYPYYTTLAMCDFPVYTRITGLHDNFPNLVPTHISNFYLIENPKLCNRIFNLELPPQKLEWESVLPLNEPFIVFQPFSCHSCVSDLHWPYWLEALNFILENISLKIVLIGEIKSNYDSRFLFPYVEHPNLVNLVGQTPNMSDVFHIVNKSVGVVSTSNGLSMYTVTNKKPNLVICNKIIKTSAFYYYNWIHHPPNIVFDCDLTLENFKIEAMNFIKGIT